MKNKKISTLSITSTTFFLLAVVIWILAPFGGSATIAQATQQEHGEEGEGHDESTPTKHDEHAEEGSDHDENSEKEIVKLTKKERKEFGIELGTVKKGKLEIWKNLSGEVVVNADRIAHIVPRLPGIVTEVRKSLGDTVRPGEVMAIIESRELADAKAAYLAAQERIALAQAIFTREKNLWEKKISSEQEYLDAKQALAETNIELRASEQKLHALGFSDEYVKSLPANPDGNLTLYKIVAPISGTVVKKHITLGEKLGDESNTFTIADLSNVWINLTVYQKDLPKIRPELHVVVRADQHDAETSGTIDYVSPFVDESTRTATARVVVDNSKGGWRPGMFVSGQVVVDELDVDMLIYRSAIQVIDSEKAVFVQTEDGFEPRHVKTGRSNKNYVEIISGLELGQLYVKSNAFTLKAELGKSQFGEGHGH